MNHKFFDEATPRVLFHQALQHGDRSGNVESNLVILAHELAAEQHQHQND